MALVLKDRVKEQTTTTGTGSVTLGGAVSGFEAFSAVGDGNTTYYAIVHQTADEWEVGLGTYTAAGTLLSRDTILESSNSDAAVVFSAGTKDVFVTYPSDKAVYYDAAGTVNIDSLRLVAGVTVTSILDEDNMASDSATALSTQQSIKAYVDAQVGTADTLSEVLALGNTTGGTDIAMTGGDKITNFESTGINDDAASTTITINSSGNVGIGTAAPSYNLDVLGGTSTFRIKATSPLMRLEDSDDGAYHTLIGSSDDLYITADAGNTGAGNMIFRNGGGTERMRIDSSGNVGIGTASPDSGTPLHVQESSASLGANPTASALLVERAGNVGMTLGTANTGTASIFFGDPDNLTTGRLQYDNNDNSLQFWANSNERMRITSSGSVGIGTSSPAVKLEVNNGSTTGTALKVSTTGSGHNFDMVDGTGTARFRNVNGEMRLYGDLLTGGNGNIIFAPQGTTERMRIDSSGNVGIGTSSPRAPLHVYPSGGATDNFNVLVSQFRPNIVLEDLSTSAIDFQFFVDGNALQFRYGDASTDTKLASEAMRIDSSGNVGIGTTSPSGILDISAATGSGTFNIISTDNATGAGNKIAFFAANRSDTDEEMAYIKPLLVTNSGGSGNVQSGQLTFGTFGSERMRIDEDGNVGIGTTAPSRALDVVAANNVGGWESTVNDTVADQNLYANLIDYNLSGSDATTTDRTHVGLRLDIDSSASGGDTSNEHRIYGIWNDIDVTADSDLVYGTYTSVRTTHTTGTITEMRGSYNLVEADGTGTVTNAYGAYNYALSGTAVSGLLNSYGSFNKYGKEAADTSTLNNAHGVYAEVECDAGTITNAYGVRSIIDRDGGTISNGYLYRGEYQGTYSSGTQWGVYLSGEEKSYFSNNVGIGTTSPVKKLHVAGPALATIGTLTDSATITPNFDTNQNFSVTLGGNRTLANPSNVDAGQTGSIFVVQDATGGRTLSFGSYWKFAGGTAPTLSTGANAVDRIDYIVKSSTEIHAVASLNLS